MILPLYSVYDARFAEPDEVFASLQHEFLGHSPLSQDSDFLSLLPIKPPDLLQNASFLLAARPLFNLNNLAVNTLIRNSILLLPKVVVCL